MTAVTMQRAAASVAKPHSSRRQAALNFLILTICVVSWAPGLLSLPGGFAPGHVITLGLFLLVATRTARLQPEPGIIQQRFLTAVFTATLFLMFWAFVSGLQGEEFYRAGRPIVGFGLASITYFALSRSVEPTKIDRILYVFVAMACLNAAVSFVAPNIDILRELIFGHRDRSSGFFKHPNQFAMVLTTLIPVALAMFLTDSRHKLLWAAALGLMLIGFILAGSKFNTGVLALAALSVGTVAALTHPSGFRAVFLFLAMLVMGALLMALTWQLILLYNPRMGSLLAQLASGEEIKSMVGRYSIWNASMAEFYADPLFGQGGGAMLPLETRDDELTHSHNVILDLMRTMGVPGLLAGLLMVAASLSLAIYQMIVALTHTRANRVERLKLFGLAIGCVSYVVANMSSDSFGPSTTPIFWIVLTLSVFQARKVQYLAAFAKKNPRVPV